MSTFNPTLQQQSAIDYQDGMVITACPGSGKTTIIKEKITEITSGLPNHKGVIAITFTNKSSQELRERCKKSARDVKQSFFGTIDSFCLKELILPFLSRVWGRNPEECKIVKRLDPCYQCHLKKLYRSPTAEDITVDDGFKNLYDAGVLWMNSFSAIALYVLNNSHSARRYIKSRYSHVFVDEYQDSSLAQHQLFLNLHSLGLVAIAVGDAWQSIYEFRGGNPGLLDELVQSSEKFKHFKVDVNHRCHPSIINYATRLLDPEAELIETKQTHMFRRSVEGNLTDVGEVVSSWIDTWLEKGNWGVKKASDFALLAKMDKSLRLLVQGLKVNYRLYSDTPLDDIGSDCSDLYSDFLAYRYGAIVTAQDLVDKRFYLSAMNDVDIPIIRRKVRGLRGDQSTEELVIKFRELASMLDIHETEASDAAVVESLRREEIIKQFMPMDESEVQVMTLHKSKGLEFKVVFHFDLEEWSFPFQQVVDNDWENPIYPSLRQDTNLHYVGITRAENCCILMRAGLRKNRNGNFNPSQPSYFLKLSQLEGLYK